MKITKNERLAKMNELLKHEIVKNLTDGELRKFGLYRACKYENLSREELQEKEMEIIKAFIQNLSHENKQELMELLKK